MASGRPTMVTTFHYEQTETIAQIWPITSWEPQSKELTLCPNHHTISTLRGLYFQVISLTHKSLFEGKNWEESLSISWNATEVLLLHWLSLSERNWTPLQTLQALLCRQKYCDKRYHRTDWSADLRHGLARRDNCFTQRDNYMCFLV